MKRLLLFILTLGTFSSLAQTESPYGHWCVYYPFEDGIQMVEIKYGITDLSKLSNWSNDVSLNRSIYIFRTASGKVTKTFNLCGNSLKEYNILPPGKVTEDKIQQHEKEEYYILENCKKIKNAPQYANIDYSEAKYGLINTQGEITLAPEYSYLNTVGNFRIIGNESKFSVINKDGKVIIPYEIDAEPTVYGNHFPIALRRNGKYIFMDKESGEILTDQPYDYADGFWSRRALVKRDNKFGFIDSTGTEVVPLIFDEATPFYFTIAVVGEQSKNGGQTKYGLVNNTGEIVQPLIYDRIEHVSGDNMGISSVGYKAIKGDEEIQFNLRGLPIENSDVYYFNHGKDFIHLTEINYGDLTFCEAPTVTEIQIDGKGSKEVIIHRKCHCNTDRHGGTYDITEHYEIEKYEVWNLDKRKLLFVAQSKYEIDYNRFEAYDTPSHSSGSEGYIYEFQIDSIGVITIQNTSPSPKRRLLNGDTWVPEEGWKQKLKVQPDHDEGKYLFIKGQYEKL